MATDNRGSPDDVSDCNLLSCPVACGQAWRVLGIYSVYTSAFCPTMTTILQTRLVGSAGAHSVAPSFQQCTGTSWCAGRRGRGATRAQAQAAGSLCGDTCQTGTGSCPGEVASS